MAAINTINKAVIYSTLLDKIITAGLKSAPLEAGAGNAEYMGGGSVKIAKLSLGGFGDYDRGSGGYPQGAVTQSWETKTIMMDRGVKFLLDAMDEDETKNVLSATNVINEFARTKAIPEIDAYRFSKIFKEIVTETSAKYEFYTPVVGTLLTKLQTKIGAIRNEIGEDEPLVCFMSGSCFTTLTTSSEITKYLDVRAVTGSNGITTKVYSVDGVDIIPVPSARMKTDFTFSATDGYSADTWAEDISFIIMAPSAAVGFIKHQKTKVVSADQNQSADGELVLSRTYHDLWVYDNKKNSFWISLSGAGTVDSITDLLTAGSGKVTYTIGAAWTNRKTGHEYYYKDTDSASNPTNPTAYDAFDSTGYTKIATAAATDVTVTATHYLVLVHVDENGRIVEYGEVAAGA